jgi:hypothetical protein
LSLTALTLACFLTASQAAAQTPVGQGSRVRVVQRSSGAAVVTGSLARLTGDSLVVNVGDSPRTFVVDQAHELQVSRGKKGRTGRGLLLGLLGGATLGAIIGAATSNESDCGAADYLCLDTPAFGALSGGLLGGLLGTAAGGIIGSQMKSERWQSVDHRGIRVAFGRGVHVAAVVRF